MELNPDSEANVSLFSSQDALMQKAVTIVLSRHLAPPVSQTCYYVRAAAELTKPVAICPVSDSRSLPKQAASFDLPITRGILAGSGQKKSGSDRQG